MTETRLDQLKRTLGELGLAESTEDTDIDLEDWAIYLNLSQKHIDKLEVAVMVQSL